MMKIRILLLYLLFLVCIEATKFSPHPDYILDYKAVDGQLVVSMTIPQ
eukprot:gene20632-7577_t